jgi:hypothetical protein
MNYFFGTLTAAQKATQNVSLYRIRRDKEIEQYATVVAKNVLSEIENISATEGLTRLIINIYTNLRGYHGTSIDSLVDSLRQVTVEELNRIGAQITSVLTSEENGFDVTFKRADETAPSAKRSRLPFIQLDIRWPSPFRPTVQSPDEEKGEVDAEKCYTV